MKIRAFAALLSLFSALHLSVSAESNERPNIIYILADDLGYGDLSSYGQQKFDTPHIDKLASEGLVFTQHYSGSTVCAPSRSCLMTGLHTGNTPIRGNREVKPEGQLPIPEEIPTLPKLLRDAGYATGAFGKWGLGFPGSEGDPMHHFDVFYGFNCQRIGHHYYPYHIWDNDQKVILKGNAGKKKGEYAPSLIHDQVLAFIEHNKDRPFFCYVPTIIPHAELVAPEKYMDMYRGTLPAGKPFKGLDDGPKYRLGRYESQPEPRVAFAAMIKLLDDQVGEIVAKINELGLSENTLIIFSSDNGPHKEGGADPDFFNSAGGLRGYKRDLYEGGIRVPMIAHWPGTVAPARRSEHISAFWDVLPTALDLAGIEAPAKIDGISFKPTLMGELEKQEEHDYLYWEYHKAGGRLAIRKGVWKAVQYRSAANAKAPIKLYDLSSDPAERNDLSAQYPEVVEEMRELFEKSHTQSEYFNFGQNPAHG